MSVINSHVLRKIGKNLWILNMRQVHSIYLQSAFYNFNMNWKFKGYSILFVKFQKIRLSNWLKSLHKKTDHLYFK